MREHGTHTKYMNDRCRCEPCRGAAREYRRGERKRRRIVANRENLRGYLDVEIGRIALGEPLMGVSELAAELGVSTQLVRMKERDLFRKYGRWLRLQEEREQAALRGNRSSAA